MAEPMATTQDFVNWVCGSSLAPEYLLFVLRGMRSEFRRITMGSTHQTIYMPDVEKFVTPLPPLCEQQKIVEYITVELEHFDALMAEARRGIELLKERRTALISAAVTGKIDVRAAA
jgi:type I restriction enzyme S subunit